MQKVNILEIRNLLEQYILSELSREDYDKAHKSGMGSGDASFSASFGPGAWAMDDFDAQHIKHAFNLVATLPQFFVKDYWATRCGGCPPEAILILTKNDQVKFIVRNWDGAEESLFPEEEITGDLDPKFIQTIGYKYIQVKKDFLTSE